MHRLLASARGPYVDQNFVCFFLCLIIAWILKLVAFELLDLHVFIRNMAAM